MLYGVGTFPLVSHWLGGGHLPWVELGPGCLILFWIALKHPGLLCSILDGSGVVWKGLDMTGCYALILLIY